jgi:hypothetical protein
LRPGNIISVDIDGLITVEQHNVTTCMIDIYMGIVKIGGCSVTDTMSSGTNVAFNINFQVVVPQPDFLRYPGVPVRTIGMMTYHNWTSTGSHGIAGFGITDYGLNTQVQIDAPAELRVVASWINSSGSGDTIEMISTKYSYTGFNTEWKKKMQISRKEKWRNRIL